MWSTSDSLLLKTWKRTKPACFLSDSPSRRREERDCSRWLPVKLFIQRAPQPHFLVSFPSYSTSSLEEIFLDPGFFWSWERFEDRWLNYFGYAEEDLGSTVVDVIANYNSLVCDNLKNFMGDTQFIKVRHLSVNCSRCGTVAEIFVDVFETGGARAIHRCGSSQRACAPPCDRLLCRR